MGARWVAYWTRLINNGLTYAVRPPRLRLDATTDSGRAIAHVIDNGVGMSDRHRVRVFHPFHRGNDPAFGSVPGVGLGLYVSRQLAEANEGSLTLERTEPGLGTSFALNLPLAGVGPGDGPAPGPGT
jgi:signal transduction histidine kinase